MQEKEEAERKAAEEAAAQKAAEEEAAKKVAADAKRTKCASLPLHKGNALVFQSCICQLSRRTGKAF